MGLTFDAVQHAYHLDGKPVPGTTTILSMMGMIDGSWYTEEAKLRGTYVHKAIAMDVENDLDQESLSPEIVPYVEAFRKFKDEFKLVVRSTERQVHVGDLYAGLLDIEGENRRGSIVLDIKTGGEEPWHPLQLAAYARPIKALRRGNLYLKPTGDYRFVERADPRDFDIFMSAVNLFHWKRAAGLIQWPEQKENAHGVRKHSIGVGPDYH